MAIRLLMEVLGGLLVIGVLSYGVVALLDRFSDSKKRR